MSHGSYRYWDLLPRKKGWTCQHTSNKTKCKHHNDARAATCGLCGKARPKRKPRPPKTSLIGQRFGRLLIIAEGSAKTRRSWVCDCDCGTRVEVLQQSLIAGLTKSCNCYRIEQAQRANLSNITGQTYGRWTATKLIDRRTVNGGVYYECECECGVVQEIASSTLIQGQSRGCKKCAVRDQRRPGCAKGHNTELWGLTDDDKCRACIKERNLLREYGITLDEYVAIWELQGRRCPICGEELDIALGQPGHGNGSRTELDHDHTEGITKRSSVRGLLCGGRWKGCNRRLGHVDDAEWLEAARRYVTDPPAQQLIAHIDVKADIG